MKTLNKKISKKISTMLLALLALNLAPNAITASAETETLAAGANLSYTVTGELKKGNTVEIALSAKDATDIYGASWDFAYDPTLLEIKSMTPGSIFPSNVNVPVNKFSNGQAELAITLTGDAKAASTSGTVAVMKVKLLKDGKVNLKTSTSNDALSATGTNCRVKLANNSAAGIAYTSTDKEIVVGTTPPPVVETSKINTLTADRISGIINEPITFTATATPATGTNFEFYVKKEGRDWAKGQYWSTNNKMSWTATSAGNYTIRVRVKHTNSPNNSDDYKDISYRVANGPDQTSKLNSLKIDKTPGTAGKNMIFTADSTFAKDSVYEYYVKKDGRDWTKCQYWSNNNKMTWAPSSAGNYTVRVRVKHNNSPNKSDDYKDLKFKVTK